MTAQVDHWRRFRLTSSNMTDEYLIVADYFSNFLLMRVLNNPMASHVINILKMMFSERGILACLFTNQGRQFTSVEF